MGKYDGLIGIPMEVKLAEPSRDRGMVIIHSGAATVNRDFWTGKQMRIDPMGIRTKNWNRSGVILYQHNFNIPLGRTEVFHKDGMLVAFDEFDFHRRKIPYANGTSIGDAIGEFDTAVIADLWEEHYLNEVSVHVVLTVEDEKNIIETDTEIVLGSSEMIEFSIVTVEADREAGRQESTTKRREEIYKFALGKGATKEFAQCVSCFAPEEQEQESDVEAQMEDLILETEGVEEEFNLDIPLDAVMDTVVEHLATEPGFALKVAQAIVGNEAAMNVLTDALQASAPSATLEQRPQPTVRLRFVRDQEPVQEAAPVPQVVPVREAASSTTSAPSKKRHPALGLLGGGKK